MPDDSTTTVPADSSDDQKVEESTSEDDPNSGTAATEAGEGLVASADDVTTTTLSDDDLQEVALSDTPSSTGSGGLLADISLDQLILVLLGFAIAIGLTVNGAVRAWRKGPA